MLLIIAIFSIIKSNFADEQLEIEKRQIAISLLVNSLYENLFVKSTLKLQRGAIIYQRHS